ncbi:TQO small subunit DoxA domain-containing protein [Acidilobus saccharovorans]|nr:TQO small subunit DoxA domain-containing protein [Acidilobus saccharovorans]
MSVSVKAMEAIAVVAFIFVTGVTLAMYQINFGGLSHLVNYSKTPAYELYGTRLYENGTLFLQVARVAGPDTYGGFISLVQVLYPNGTVLYQWNESQLAHIPSSDITNKYDLPGHLTHSTGFALEVPLGQNSTIILQMPMHVKPGNYIVRVYDVDGQDSAYGITFQVEVMAQG